MNKTSFGIKNFSKNQANPYILGNSFGESANTIVQINKSELNKIFNLSRTGLKLLYYLLSNYDESSKTIHFQLDESKSFLGFGTKRSIYNALIELLGERIIARTNNENLFYLNTQIVEVCRLINSNE